MYIGRQPTIGNFVVLDAITTSATDTFALTSGGNAYYPASANHCIVSLNGVIQAPISSFTISGSNIVFASALTTSDVIDFIQVLGDVLNIGTPSDGTVGIAKLSATGTPSSSTFLRGDNTWQSAGGANTPAFQAYKSSLQNILASSYTKITFDTENFDTNSAYDTSTSKFTVPSGQAGKYYFYGNVLTSGWGSTESQVYSYLYVNGTSVTNVSNWYTSSIINQVSLTTSCVLNLSVNDYVEIYVYMAPSDGAVREPNNGTRTIFGGYKLIE